MNRRVPRVVPWKSEQELSELREEFYNGDKRRALSRVKMLETRGAVPPSIEATSLLMSALLDDIPESDSFATRCAYSMALIRFVNGQLDQFQRSQMAIPLHKLAQMSGLPSFFVEIRHTATHEGLPSLEFLRESTTRALDWLWERYWSVNDYEETTEVEDAKTKEQIKQSFREWRRLRRADPVKSFKAGDTSPEGIQYWNLVRAIEKYKLQDEQLLLDVLYRQNVLVPTSVSGPASKKVQSAIKLFSPLLDELNTDGFVERLAQYGLDLLNAQDIDFTPASYIEDKPHHQKTVSAQQLQTECIVEWLKYFTTPRAKKQQQKWLDTDKFLASCLEWPRSWNLELLNHIGSTDPKVVSLTEDMHAQLNGADDPTPQQRQKRKLDEIEHELEQFSKRVLSQPGDEQTGEVRSASGWSVVSNWTPRAIGQL